MGTQLRIMLVFGFKLLSRRIYIPQNIQVIYGLQEFEFFYIPPSILFYFYHNCVVNVRYRRPLTGREEERERG